ncbi:MAG: lecithin retinol acyltransferase family protein [Actinobacteria bacterium]|nr:lecithin retinol acyltransferase family protein [Actinomycetota bacterium]
MRGEHVYVKRRGYTHHGVEVDGREVIHFTGTPGNKRGAMIRRTTLQEFTGPRGKLRYRRYGQQFSADLVVERAESKLGRSGYSLFSNTCEHFATWCVHDRTASALVYGAKATGAVTTATAAVAAAGIGIRLARFESLSQALEQLPVAFEQLLRPSRKILVRANALNLSNKRIDDHRVDAGAASACDHVDGVSKFLG